MRETERIFRKLRLHLNNYSTIVRLLYKTTNTEYPPLNNSVSIVTPTLILRQNVSHNNVP